MIYCNISNCRYILYRRIIWLLCCIVFIYVCLSQIKSLPLPKNKETAHLNGKLCKSNKLQLYEEDSNHQWSKFELIGEA